MYDFQGLKKLVDDNKDLAVSSPHEAAVKRAMEWLVGEVERLRRIENAACALEISLDVNGRAYAKHKLINLYETLEQNPRPGLL